MVSLSLNLPQYLKSPFFISTGYLATQSNGSVTVSLADTVTLVTVCMGDQPKEERNFLPLIVDYQERTYAMGKIPGGFIKREGRPKDSEILCARLIDRPLRPLFPKELTNDVQIVAMVLSSDCENDPDILTVNGASCALLISDIPFFTPVGAVRVARGDGKFILNPTYQERENSDLDMVVVGTEEKIVMIEGKYKEVTEEDVFSAIKFAQPLIKEIIKLQKDFREKVGKPKQEISKKEENLTLRKVVEETVSPKLESIYQLIDKKERSEAIEELITEIEKKLEKNNEEINKDKIKDTLYEIDREFVRRKILNEGRRPDQRGLDEIRTIDCKVRVLPRTHGSAVFTRGQTQSLAVVTLGTSSDEQMIEALEGEKFKHFMLHYSFPPFSVGEVKPLRGPSRREIGHGALAEKSLLSIIPDKEEFPYTIRVVSEILESNGSSSMATVCAASLALMDAGVPIKNQVAGVALGLVEENGNYKILTDIAGVEDHYGDMDFKIAGTNKGITAIQLDVKNEGLSLTLIEECFQKAKTARLFILDKMNEALSLPRENVSEYAPKIKSFKVDYDKIGEIIGPGGRTIRKIIRENNVTIDIDDDTGRVAVVAEKQEDLERVVNTIMNLTREINIGDVLEVKVARLTNFGAFCEIAPGKVGLLHISEISHKFVKDIKEFLQENQIIKVKVINIDAQGRITLSKKQAE